MISDIEQQVLQYIRGLRPANGSVAASTDLIDSGVLDSLAIVELIAFVSKCFSVVIPARELTPENLRTAQAVAALVENCRR